MQDTQDVVVNKRSDEDRKKSDEDRIPTWIKLFGGTIISITFLCLVTVTGYFVNNMSSLQSQLNSIASESISKTMWDQSIIDTKSNADAIVNCKERINGLEQVFKEKSAGLEKTDNRINNTESDLRTLSKELAAHKEKCSALEQTLSEERENYKQVVRDLQALKERIAVVEGKSEKQPKER